MKDLISNSTYYSNESLCLADLVFKLNGESDIDLTEYDIDRRELAKVKPKTVQTTKKKMRDNNEKFSKKRN